MDGHGPSSAAWSRSVRPWDWASARCVFPPTSPSTKFPPARDGKKIEINGWVAALNILFSVGFFIFMYKFLPLVATTELKQHVSPVFGNQIVFNVVDGIIRLGSVPGSSSG